MMWSLEESILYLYQGSFLSDKENIETYGDLPSDLKNYVKEVSTCYIALGGDPVMMSRQVASLFFVTWLNSRYLWK